MFKRISLLTGALLIVISSSLLITCKKSSDDTPATVTPTCADGIQNQGETGIDCGGPCAACPSSSYLKATINGTAWTASITNIGVYAGSAQIKAGSMGTSPDDSIFMYTGGPLTLNSSTSVNGSLKVNGTLYASGSGQLTVTDTSNKKMNGTFIFSAGGKSVSGGIIKNITFHN